MQPRATKFGSSNMFETKSTIASIVAHFMSVREIIVMLHLSLLDKRFVTILMMFYPHIGLVISEKISINSLGIK